MIRIRFVTSHDIVSWAIRGAEMGFQFSHAEVIMPDNTLLGAHMDGGVEARPWGYDAAYNPIEMIAEIDADQADADTFYDYLRSQIGKPYDMAAIEAFALGSLHPVIKDEASPAWTDPAQWFCSELVIAALDRAGLFPNGLPFSPVHVTPRDLVFALAPMAKFSKTGQATRPQASSVVARPV